MPFIVEVTKIHPYFYKVDILSVLDKPLKTYLAVRHVFVDDVELNLPFSGKTLLEAKKVEEKGVLNKTIYIYT